MWRTKNKKGSYGSEVDQQSKNKSEVWTLFDVDVMYSSIQILHFGTSEGREQYHIQKGLKKGICSTMWSRITVFWYAQWRNKTDCTNKTN